MNISYNWLAQFIPGIPAPDILSSILTSVGLEVENLQEFQQVKGNLAGLVAGEILKCEQHPQAEKLKITEVSIGNNKVLQIVCGATNVAKGQKVIVAQVGTTIYPVNTESVTIKKVKIRGIESNGMLCAEDEIGLGNDHGGIVILPNDITAGASVTAYFQPVNDWIFEIGLTPNRSDAMSHIGVAKDVCAYLSYHTKTTVSILSSAKVFKPDNNNHPIEVHIKNEKACERYAGVSIANVRVEPSPGWLQLRLKSIGLRPVNNIVDITNYFLHETGQPLHAFDLRAIKGNKIIVENLQEGTAFVTLDDKERKLNSQDLMICNGLDQPMCFGGVFGGLLSGVKDLTTDIFLESAWFNPGIIRTTSLTHNLRTDAAIRFEKGVDISQTVEVLTQAAIMIKEITGGEIASAIIDVYPNPKHQSSIKLNYDYLKKIAGKDYDRSDVKAILGSLGFQIAGDDVYGLTVMVPFTKPDVTLPVDLIEEIMRIDGYDNVQIPLAINITPALDANIFEASYREKIANYLTGAGFSEIFTNSITNSKYYPENILQKSVQILNSLSSDLDIMRPSLKETGLETITYNLNRKNSDLFFFEFGKSYLITSPGNYQETEHLCLYASGYKNQPGWKGKPARTDFYFLKGVCESIFNICELTNVEHLVFRSDSLQQTLISSVNGVVISSIEDIEKTILESFDVKQPVLIADINWKNLLNAANKTTVYSEIPKYPAVHRDLSVVVNKESSYAQLDQLIKNLGFKNLNAVTLFDVFESEKLGIGKKAFAISLTFVDKEKTLTDKEVEGWMARIISSFKDELNAEIRK